MEDEHMKGFSISALAAATLLGIGTAYAADVSVKLSGDQEVPPTPSAATGSGTITVKDDKSVTGSVKTTGLEGTAAHIHLAEAGKNGPPIITLTKGEGGSWSVPADSKLTDEQFAAFKAGHLYVNIHSAAHKPGEIRAQLKP
jgi:hypothetical protein